ncbi:MAG: C4-type zinc ribbon domain-containing protein [Desulfatiglandaceae bacterium]
MKLLIGLQGCDNRIGLIQKKKEEAPAKIKRLREALEERQARLDGELHQAEVYQRERRQTEKDIEYLESRIEKSKIKLNNIKSNKEYKAGLKELSELEKDKSLSEDKILEIMEQLEAFEGRCAAGKAEKEELEVSFERERDEVLKEIKALDESLESLENERTRFCESIDPDLLKRYDILRQRKGGLAISPVIKGVCQSCHMGIPPQKFNELIRGNALMACPNCNRIIYWGDDARFQ